MVFEKTHGGKWLAVESVMKIRRSRTLCRGLASAGTELHNKHLMTIKKESPLRLGNSNFISDSVKTLGYDLPARFSFIADSKPTERA